MDEQIVKHLMASLKCRHCGSQYGSGNIQVLGHRQETWFLSVYCPHCHHEGLLALSVRRERSRPPATDLTPQETARFAQLPPISAGEALNLHLFLQDFDGDFAGAFGPG